MKLSTKDKKILGVCGGIAEYLNADVTLTRFIFILLFIFPATPAILIYLILWLLMEK
jgi:phage shock protein C